MTKNFVCVCV